MTDKLNMNEEHDSQSLWFKDIVQPQLDILSKFLVQGADLKEFDANAFFKLLLADLELLGLDNMVVENCAERITDGIETIRGHNLDLADVDLREVAMVALLKSRFDRPLFKAYWSHYLPLMKKHKDLKDESIINAYKVQLHINALVNYIMAANHSSPEHFEEIA